MEYDPITKRIWIDRATYKLPAGACAPASLVLALYRHVDISLTSMIGRLRTELLCCARRETELRGVTRFFLECTVCSTRNCWPSRMSLCLTPTGYCTEKEKSKLSMLCNVLALQPPKLWAGGRNKSGVGGWAFKNFRAFSKFEYLPPSTSLSCGREHTMV